NMQGEFYRWNKNMLTVTGYTDDEMTQITPFELFYQKDHDLLGYKISNVFQNGKDEVEVELKTKSGEGIFYYFNGKKIIFEGEPCLIGCGIDISERMKSQEKLQASEEKFRSLIEQAADGIYIMDESGRFLVVNSSFSLLTGYSMEEMLKMHCDEVFQGGNVVNR